ncbi:MAG TPA: hypothetical protein VFN97_02365 [Actinospica sp.]|nr:hypothetical protein [Actinospica sp.]
MTTAQPDPKPAPTEVDAAADGSAPPDELAELRARVRSLETARAAPGRRRWRVFSSALLIVLSCLLALLSVVAVWANSQVTDTDRYVATVAPLAENPDVQNAITNRVTTVVLDQIDVKALVDQLSAAMAERGVPPRATALVNGLSGPITSGLTSVVSSTVHTVVTSSAFATIWADANRAIHQTMVKALTGQGGGAVSLANNQVAIDLAPIIDQVKTRLVDSGLAVAAKIPTVHTSFVVFQSQDLGKIKTYVQLLDIAGNWLPIVAVLIGAWGVYLAKDRRRALFRAAVGYALAMLALGLGLTAFRQVYLNHLPPGVNQGAAGAVYDALVDFLREGLRAVGALAVVTAIGAYVIGPSRSAVAIRTACRTGIGAVRGVAESMGFRAGPVGTFVHHYKHWIGAVILAGAAISLFFWNHATVSVVLWLAVIVLAAFAVREFLDSPRSRTKEASP